ncbi:K+/H+ antiporter subunit F [Amphibiibacter pelophylacis]|uniref:K+/H+ antiporter subunit F n=1 Tax=Amphibiibacter pelophylacis TaxID=1799477 RepID=A0ACC6P0D3_9BURK
MMLMHPLLSLALQVCGAALVLSLLLCGWRLWRGPTLIDRLLALDTLYLYTVALVVWLGMVDSTPLLFEAAVLIALLGFASTVAVARYITRGEVIE